MWPFRRKRAEPDETWWKCRRCGQRPTCVDGPGAEYCGNIWCKCFGDHPTKDDPDVCVDCASYLKKLARERNKRQRELAAMVAGGLGLPDPYRGVRPEPQDIAQRAWEIAGAIIDLPEVRWRKLLDDGR